MALGGGLACNRLDAVGSDADKALSDGGGVEVDAKTPCNLNFVGGRISCIAGRVMICMPVGLSGEYVSLTLGVTYC